MAIFHQKYSGSFIALTRKTACFPDIQVKKPYKNYAGPKYQLLPKIVNADTVTYTEWDIYPDVKGVDRGNYRLITGSDHSAYFTSDHYFSFVSIR
ncbi:ribonuclease domain-containing protein [Arthrobacter silviterrae]